MNPCRLPIACELFAQWRRARGDRETAATRPFSRGWEELLEDAGILAAPDRNDAERDAHRMEQDGWLRLRPVPYRSHLIGRITLPLDQEARWMAAFGFHPPSDEEARRLREHPWQPELAFLSDVRATLAFEELLLLDRFLAQGGRHCVTVPIKERSLQIFGDEKRLDLLSGSSLFREGRLTLEQLRCEVVAEPLAWKRGPAAAAGCPVLVLENAATWHSFDRWNQSAARFSAVLYGCGNRFADGVGFLAEIFRELGGARPIHYFGDLDAAGLCIPCRADRRARLLGLPGVEPCLPAYTRLLSLADRATLTDGEDPVRRDDCDWLGPLATDAWVLLSAGRRLAQEHVGWERLSELGLNPPTTHPASG